MSRSGWCCRAGYQRLEEALGLWPVGDSPRPPGLVPGRARLWRIARWSPPSGGSSAKQNRLRPGLQRTVSAPGELASPERRFGDQKRRKIIAATGGLVPPGPYLVD